MESLPSLLESVARLLLTQMGLMLVILGGAWLFLRTGFAGRRRVYRLPFGQGQLASELTAGMFVLLYSAATLALQVRSGHMRLGEPGLGNTLVTFTVLFVFNEIWFYVSHRALHSPALYFLHAQHHTARVVSPFSSFSFSLAEQVLNSAPATVMSLLLSHVMPLSAPGVMAFSLVNLLGSLVAHLNVELFPAGFARTALGRVLFSSTFHSMHHARYRGHYGLYTRVMDRLLGTEFPDYAELQSAAARGQGLTDLGTQLPVEASAPRSEPRDAAPVSP
jgi:sterol desaturase/sphingolipid hydroxylase (fatty acid hydroxylase superfamily)